MTNEEFRNKTSAITKESSAKGRKRKSLRKANGFKSCGLWMNTEDK
jgi:hypothetical protein